MNESPFYHKSKRLQLYQIIDKQQKKVRFKRNHVQELLEKRKRELKEKFWRIRLIVLKWRQMGITTNEAISWLDDAVIKPNQNVWILAQVDKTRDEIFDKVKTAYNELPHSLRLKDWKVWYKPTTKYSTKKELEFLENHSKISIITDSRGWTRSKLHISEFAFINNASELLAWTLPSVPKNSDIIIESTANGIGNEFQKMRTKYYWKDSFEWNCIFLWWWLVPEYSLELEENEKIKLPPELEHLNKPMIDWTVLSEEQKKRYLNTYNSYTNPDYCFQEYPSTPEEAFLNTWKPVFKTNVIKNLIINEYEEDSQIPNLFLYSKPTKWQSVFGWDTSAWVEWWDNSCIVVRDWETWILQACYYGLCEPSYLCKVIDRLLELWYWWRIWIEKNNTWYAFYERAREKDWYSLLYTTTTVDKRYNTATQNIWRVTDSKTRPIILEWYKEAINKNLIKDTDPRIKTELFTFIYNEQMREEAQIGYHDDGIMTDAICREMRKFPMSEF